MTAAAPTPSTQLVAAAVGGRERRPAAAALGCLFLALYFLPTFVPPGPILVPEVGPEMGLWTRLFPHAPTWMAFRLAALGAGALLLAWAGRATPLAVGPITPAPASAAPVAAGVTWCEWAALVAAALVVLLASGMSHLSHWGQLGALAALAVPAAVLAVADRLARMPRPVVDPAERRGWAAVIAIVAIWLVWRIALARSDPRAADLVDMWKNFTFFLDAATRPAGSLAETYEVGVSSMYLLSIGLPFVSSGWAEPTFAWIQLFHAGWAVLTALAVAGLARRLGGAAAMPLAAAALLFSPFMLSMALCITPFAFMTALGAGLALLVCRLYEGPRRADVAALAAVAGLSASLPHLTLAAITATLAAVPWVLRRRPPLVVWAAALLTGTAAVLPALSNLLEVRGMSEMYLERRGAGMQLEQLILGQVHHSHRQVAALWQAGYRGVFDVPLAALLQPFAILRWPVRLAADTYFEPLSAALAGVGLVAVVARCGREGAARILALVFAIGVVPAMASATDRASLTRNLLLPVTMPLLTVAGLRIAAGAWGATAAVARLAPVLAAAMMLSGGFLFDAVNPRILPATWLGIFLQAASSASSGEVLLLEHGNPPNDWLHVAEIGRYLPAAPLATRAYRDGGSLLADPEGEAPAAALFAWSPSLEQQGEVSRWVCQCWPGATLYTLADLAGLSRAYAARTGGGAWAPALPDAQWSASPCPQPAAARGCAPLRAMARDAIGQDLAAQGLLAAAEAAHREAIGIDPEYAPPRVSLALVLAARGARDEAIGELRRALQLDPDLTAAHNNLALLLEDTGQRDEALEHYFSAVRLAPTDPRARLNLGSLLASFGRFEEAEEQTRAAVRWAPFMPEAHALLAEVLLRQGREAEAIGELHLALRDRPGWPAATEALALTLATAADSTVRNPAEAVRLADGGVAATGGVDARLLRALAVAQAAAGDRLKAKMTAERAIGVARAQGDAELAAVVADWLADLQRKPGAPPR